MSSCERQSGRALRVLVVDDCRDTSFSLAAFLNLVGIPARAVQNGQEALQAVEAQWPDVVFLDISMPGMHGYTVAKRIRELASTKTCPRIAAITGHARPECLAESLAEGLDEHFVKPVDPATLLAWLTE